MCDGRKWYLKGCIITSPITFYLTYQYDHWKQNRWRLMEESELSKQWSVSPKVAAVVDMIAFINSGNWYIADDLVACCS